MKYKVNEKESNLIISNVLGGVFLAVLGFALGVVLFSKYATMYSKGGTEYTQTSSVDVQEALESGGLVLDGNDDVLIKNGRRGLRNAPAEVYTVQPASGSEAVQPTQQPQ